MSQTSSYETVRLHGLGDWSREQRRSRPARIAVVDGDVRLNYAQLDARVNRLAAVLRAHGVEQGSRMLWLGQNSFRTIEALLAAAKLGAVICNANWRMSPAEIGLTLSDYSPTVVFWQDHEIGTQATAAREEYNGSAVWIQHDGAGGNGYEALLASASPDDIDTRIDPRLPVLAIYTAAFDGRPMAALLSQESLLMQGLLSMQSQQIAEDSSYLVSGPMFHVGVMMGTLAAWMAGGRCVFQARSDAQSLIESFAVERVSHGFLLPPTVAQMRELNKEGAYDVSSLFATPDMSDWRSPLVMPATAPLMRSMGAYGQTEIGGLSVLTWLGGSGAGRPAPFIQVTILDEAGQEVESGQIGEIAARGSLVMCGYLNREAENARRTRDGWHRSNDLGLRLPDGSLVFVGPKTTMIKSGMENIYPAEVEAGLRSHTAVADVCVIGVPDPTWHQNVKAVVVLKAGHSATEEALIEHCRERMASYKKPKLVTFADALPRTGAGTLDRAAVDAKYGGGNYPSAGSTIR